MTAAAPGTAPSGVIRLLLLIVLPVRFVLTALAFGLFGLGGLLFRFPLAPLINCLSRDPVRRHKLARSLVRRWFAVFIRLLGLFGLVQVSVKNAERLQRPGLILAANHPSLIDVVALIAHVPESVTIVKAALLDNPFTRPPIQAAGYISNADGTDALRSVGAELDAGASFVIFPEGTRTPVDLPEGQFPRIHRGTLALALELGRPVTPVRLTCSPRWLTKDRGWWHMPLTPVKLVLDVQEDIPAAPLVPLYKERPSAACRQMAAQLSAVLFGKDAA